MGTGWVILGLAGIAAIAFIGASAEVALMKLFWPPLYRLGPALVRLAGTYCGVVRSGAIACAAGGLEGIVVREISSTMLLARRGVRLSSVLELPPVWSPRLTIELRADSDETQLRLEVRHGICWPGFLMVPMLGALYAVMTQPSIGLLGFLLACAAVTTVPVIASVLAARADALRVWDALTTRLGRPADPSR